MNRFDCYRSILESVFPGLRCKDFTDWDRIEFVQDIEESLRSLPRPARVDLGSLWSLSSVLIMRHSGYKLKEIGDLNQCSVDRVRQVLSQATRMMRHPSRSIFLRPWVEQTVIIKLKIEGLPCPKKYRKRGSHDEATT